MKTQNLPFTKVQSLGNDFILLNFLNIKNKKKLPQKTISYLCNRHFGIGADGILLLTQKNKTPHVQIFNADGTQAELCLNGARCVSYYLYKTHNFPKQFTFTMGNSTLTAKIIETKNGIEVLNKIEMPRYVGTKTVLGHTGHVIDSGNPHFVIFSNVTHDWLKQNGKKIESHPSFLNKTNVEFVHKLKKNIYELFVFERGCGITLACGSGACAALCALFELKKVKEKEKVVFQMLGGKLLCWLEDGFVHLQANAHLVFEGKVGG